MAAAVLAVAFGAGVLAVVPDAAGAAGAQNIKIAVGLFHTCVALPGGNAKCWGLNQNGDLGSGSNVAFYRRPVKVLQLSGITAVSAGDYHTCALLKAGTVKCWGVNESGEVGNGTTTVEKLPVGVSGLSGVSAIAVGGNHSCALLKAGTVKCWGENNDGVLGNGSTANRKRPYPVSGLSGVSAIATSGNDACALLKAGTVKCWGENAHGQLGGAIKSGPQFCEFANFSYACSTTPVAVKGLSGVAAIAVGDTHACALLKTGTVKCWGGNGYGQLGNGTLTSSKAPVTARGLKSVIAISAGGRTGDDSCALLKGGTVKCWGYNQDGQLGNGTTAIARNPTSVAGLGGVTGIATGDNHSCAWLASNQAKCWGNNVHGQLGNGTTANAKKAVNVIRL